MDMLTATEIFQFSDISFVIRMENNNSWIQLIKLIR